MTHPFFGFSNMYTLDGRVPVRCNDALKWGEWYARADRHVAQTTVGPLSVSTVFLGLNHNFMGKGRPLLFETMVFGDFEHYHQGRCSTWEEAEAMHAEGVAHAQAQVKAAPTNGWIEKATEMLRASRPPSSD